MSQAGALSTGGGGGGDVTTLTGDTGGPIAPIAGNIDILGGTTGFTFVGTAGTLTLTGSGGGATTFDGNTGTATPAAGVLNIIGTGGITTSGAGNTLTITGSASGFVWADIVASQPLVAGHGYFVVSGALSLSLPATSAVGDTISVSLVDTGTSWTITQAAGQKIRVGNIASTVGAGGSVSSTQPGDTITIVSYSNGLWQTTAPVGELSII